MQKLIIAIKRRPLSHCGVWSMASTEQWPLWISSSFASAFIWRWTAALKAVHLTTFVPIWPQNSELFRNELGWQQRLVCANASDIVRSKSSFSLPDSMRLNEICVCVFGCAAHFSVHGWSISLKINKEKKSPPTSRLRRKIYFFFASLRLWVPKLHFCQFLNLDSKILRPTTDRNNAPTTEWELLSDSLTFDFACAKDCGR